MKVGIMQPYFLPYIGYFQLIAAVDLFIVYDNIKYTKKGWINRNRMLRNGVDVTFSLPLKKASDFLDVVDRELSPDWDRQKFLNQIIGSYSKAPEFNSAFKCIEKIVNFGDSNLFRYIYYSISEICWFLEINTKICLSSEIKIDHDLKSQDKVIALCKAVNGDTYINAAGGVGLYSSEVFKASHIDLKFIKSKPLEYCQFEASFVPWLSILDVMMFNSRESIKITAHSGYEFL